MKTIRAPRSTEGAADLLGRYAEVDAKLAAVEACRRLEIGRINAAADVEAGPLVEEIKAIAAVLKPWWESDGRALATGGRKSVQLGGCMVGSRAGRATLGYEYADEAAAVAALRETRYAKATTRVKYTLDRAATLKLVQADGAAGKALIGLGFKVEQNEAFFVERVEQAGVVGA